MSADMIKAALPSLHALDLKIMQMPFAGSLGANLFPCVCGEGSGDERNRHVSTNGTFRPFPQRLCGEAVCS